jgi:DNA-binding NtrC family response regulator
LPEQTWVAGSGEEDKMNQHICALLIHDRKELFEPLRRTLADLAVETYSVATCQQAKHLISHWKPQIIFTEKSVADGSWMNVVNMAETADPPLTVIVVGTIPDTQLYLSTMERGAFDFVAPPFEHEPLKFVLRSAALNATRHRECLSKALPV